MQQHRAEGELRQVVLVFDSRVDRGEKVDVAGG
jgi:hypothetical protein